MYVLDSVGCIYLFYLLVRKKNVNVCKWTGNHGVWVDLEDVYTVILILGTLFAALFGGIYYKRGQNPVKKAQKRNESSVYDNLTQYREVEKNTILDILKQKDNQIKSLNARLKQFEPQEELIDENIKNNKKVTWEEIQTLAQQVVPQYAAMLPLMKKQIMEITKDMSSNEILDYVKQFTGNKEPKGQTDPQSAEYNPNWA